MYDTTSDHNGYKDVNQSIVSYAVRELGNDFDQLIADDPIQTLETWRKSRINGRGINYVNAGIATLGVLAGMLTGATPLAAVGVVVAGVCVMIANRHDDGAKRCTDEIDMLDQCGHFRRKGTTKDS
jgi:hypothetical protein